MFLFVWQEQTCHLFCCLVFVEKVSHQGSRNGASVWAAEMYPFPRTRITADPLSRKLSSSNMAYAAFTERDCMAERSAVGFVEKVSFTQDFIQNGSFFWHPGPDTSFSCLDVSTAYMGFVGKVSLARHADLHMGWTGRRKSLTSPRGRCNLIQNALPWISSGRDPFTHFREVDLSCLVCFVGKVSLYPVYASSMAPGRSTENRALRRKCFSWVPWNMPDMLKKPLYCNTFF